MRKTLILIVLTFFVLSCKTNSIDKPERPENLISKNKMVDILYDITIINSAKGINRKILESNGIFPEEYVFTKHNIDSLQFALSNAYYAYNLKIYEDIYNKVRIKLNKDKTHFNNIIDIERKERDSISKSKRKELDSISKARIGPKPKNNKFESTEKQRRLKKIDTSLKRIDQ